MAILPGLGEEMYFGELAELRELVRGITEEFPGESPDNQQILDWIREIKEKAWMYDSLNH